MTLTEDKKNDLKARFQSIFESEKKIEALKEEMKVYNDSIKETFKSIAEVLELDPKDSQQKKALVAGYKEYLMSVTDPTQYDTLSEVFNILSEGDYFGLNPKEGE